MALPVDPYLVVAVLLLLLGVIGSVVPLVPGVLLSIIGVVVYWWSTAYVEPSALFVAIVVVVGGVTMVVDYLAGAISARAGGASLVTTGLAAFVSLVLLFIVGPLGIIVGVAGTVFLVEFYQTQRVERSSKAALYATVGVLAATAVQFVITMAILIGFLLTILV